MELGCYGRLESVVPPTTVPAWMCMATSQDPGSLGVYGIRNRVGHSYADMSIVNSESIQQPAIWDQVAREEKRSIIIGVPPSHPPRKVNGICVGCFMTPDVSKTTYAHPPEIQEEIARLLGDYPVDVKDFHTADREWLARRIFAMSHTQFQLARHFLKTKDWDYFQFVDIGLDRVQQAFWQYHDASHVLYEPGNQYQNVIRDYYLQLDQQMGEILELVPADTIVLVISSHGAQRLDGGFCVNEWLVREGLLVLNEYPKVATPLSQLDIDWKKTKVWSDEGCCARLFFNVKGREPSGTIEENDYQQFRDEIKAELEAALDDKCHGIGAQAFKPEETYRRVSNVAPDLVVYFGGLHWRAIGGVGYPGTCTPESDAGTDGCNQAQFGGFMLAGPSLPLYGEVQGAHVLDMSPTLLNLGGYDIPSAMQGKSLFAGMTPGRAPETGITADEEEILRERLSGLGYIG
jgi:predicted AlkP superfamily phosphohydrolase/phosphomutase